MISASINLGRPAIVPYLSSRLGWLVPASRSMPTGNAIVDPVLADPFPTGCRSNRHRDGDPFRYGCQLNHRMIEIHSMLDVD
jgi:hypothetical protein